MNKHPIKTPRTPETSSINTPSSREAQLYGYAIGEGVYVESIDGSVEPNWHVFGYTHDPEQPEVVLVKVEKIESSSTTPQGGDVQPVELRTLSLPTLIDMQPAPERLNPPAASRRRAVGNRALHSSVVTSGFRT